MNINWKALNPFEEEKPKTIDVSKPLEKQLNPQPQPYSAQPQYNFVQSQQPSSTFQGFVQQPAQLSDEEKQKWMDFLSNAYGEARKANPIFDDFEKQVDALSTVLVGAPDAQKIQAVYAIMNGKGIGKSQILDAAQKVMQSINDSKTNFDNDLQARTKTGVTDLQQQIQDKLAAITGLQNDIAQLTQTINENQTKIATRGYGFNTCFGVVMAKVSKDVNDISNYIIG